MAVLNSIESYFSGWKTSAKHGSRSEQQTCAFSVTLADVLFSKAKQVADAHL